MGISQSLSPLLEEFAKVIRCPPIFFLFVLRGSHASLSIQVLIFYLRAFELELMLHGSHTCALRMIVWFSLNQVTGGSSA
jgi:hypothetical protein